MNIEDQVCSLELSTKLKELGVKQEGYFVWFKLKEHSEYSLSEYWQVDDPERFDEISTFTASELGDLLPNDVDTKKDEPFNFFRIQITKFFSVTEKGKAIRNFIVNYKCDSAQAESLLCRMLIKNIYDPNLTNAMAKMLIYLIENNLWRPK